MSKKDELKGSKIEDLKKSLKEAQKELVNMRIENAQQKLKNVNLLSLKRKEIARIKTFITERQLENAG